MTRKIVQTFDPAIDAIVKLSTSLPEGSYCANAVIPLTRREVLATIAKGTVLISNDGKAALLAIATRVTWFLCPLNLVSTSGKELLDEAIPAGADMGGMIKNNALRDAVHAARPDLTLDGETLLSVPEPAPEVPATPAPAAPAEAPAAP